MEARACVRLNFNLFCPIVATNGLAKMIRVWASSFISINTKSHGMKNLQFARVILRDSHRVLLKDSHRVPHYLQA